MVTNIFGFIPSPIVFGVIIDTSCVAWHSVCASDKGHCILYDNQNFKHKYHLANAGFQLLAILAVVVSWFAARKFKFPEDEAIDQSVSHYSVDEVDDHSRET